MARLSPAARTHARLARSRTSHSPSPYLTSGERSHEWNPPATVCTIGTAGTSGIHTAQMEPACNNWTLHDSEKSHPDSHGTQSSTQRQDQSKNIRRSKPLWRCRTPDPAADAQHCIPSPPQVVQFPVRAPMPFFGQSGLSRCAQNPLNE